MIQKVLDKYMGQSYLGSETKNNQFDYINLGVKPTNIDHYFGFHSNTCFEIYHLWSHLGEKNHTKNVKHH